jgi:hypothetical protein
MTIKIDIKNKNNILRVKLKRIITFTEKPRKRITNQNNKDQIKKT